MEESTSHPLLSSCLSLLTSKNDSEKLAGLLLATKLEGVSHELYSTIFKTIGNKFLIRLVRSKQNPGDTLRLGLTIIESFSRITSVRNDVAFQELLCSLFAILPGKASLISERRDNLAIEPTDSTGNGDGNAIQTPSRENDDVKTTFVSICTHVSQDRDGCRFILSTDCCRLLWDMVVSDTNHYGTTSACIDVIIRCFSISMTDSQEVEMELEIRHSVSSNLEHFVDSLSAVNDAAQRLHLAALLVSILESLGDDLRGKVEIGNPRLSGLSWQSRLGTVVKGILLSKTISPKSRETGFHLASSIARLTASHDWMREDDGENDESSSSSSPSVTKTKFFLILFRLTCLELQLKFDNDADDAVAKLWEKRRFVAVLSTLVERLVGENDEEREATKKTLTEDQFDQMRLSHIALFGAVNDFLVSRSEAIVSRLGEESERSGDNAAESDNKIEGFRAVVRLYGFLADDDEIAQTEEFAKGAAVVLRVEAKLSRNACQAPFRASLLHFIAPGLFRLSLDEEFFEEVAGTIGDLLIQLYSDELDKFKISSSSSSSSSFLDNTIPNAIFAVFLNLTCFSPGKVMKLDLRRTLLQLLSAELSSTPANQIIDLRFAYVSTLALKITSQSSSPIVGGSEERSICESGLFFVKNAIKIKRRNEASSGIGRVVVSPATVTSAQWKAAYEELFVSSLESFVVIAKDDKKRLKMFPNGFSGLREFCSSFSVQSVTSHSISNAAILTLVELFGCVNMQKYV